MNQTSIFDMLYPKYKITKPILLIEMFGGYGSQYMALKRIGANVKHHKLIEWAAKSIQTYNDIHIQDYTDYSKDLTDEEVLNKVYEMGVSLNYNEPATKEQLKRQNYRKIYNNIIATNNLVNIQNVKGEDLEMVDTDKYDYIWTYSFPCQDLSNAGLKKGFNDTSTRSGMLWEVERILEECDKIGQKPRILLMENVIQVHSPGENLENFHKWQLKLESLGYKNYMQDLIATDYGIPQTRNRCFMVSILGDYSYTFPQPIPLKLKLKDMLEDNVKEKYYIEDNLLQHIIKTKEEHKEYTQYDRYNGAFEQLCRVWKDKAPTLHTKSNDIKIYDKNRIRYLTCKEVFRLMGVSDEDFEKCAKNQSNASLYHLAGDSIVVDVLCHIFNQFFKDS